jgi:hypothetical protein
VPIRFGHPYGLEVAVIAVSAGRPRIATTNL